MRKASLIVFALAVLLAAGAVPAMAQDAPQQEKPKEAVAAADPISGTWDGTVSMPEAAMPFFMTLKLEKDKVTGEIGSHEGTSPVTGTWLDGKLALSFTYVDGQAITLSGGLKDDQLTGEISVSGGQWMMTFVAKKKA